MKVQKKSALQALVIATTIGLLVAQTGVAQAAKKTITCYKGTSTKKVTTAKCPTGWSTKKPTAVKPAPGTPSAKTVAINGNYTGTVSLLWGDTYVQVTSVKATGTGTVADLGEFVGSGAAAPASQCDTFDGAATLGTGADTIKVAFDSSAKGCAEDDSAPTKITFSGNAVIKSGTGKYAGASGTFKVSGSFSIKTITAGSKESTPFTMSAAGNITLK
ncbi:MAG: hypothetical protein F2768_00300 [Actinobacteria bacterium]|uniref:Unannotated protein n=1 Tax=freshwater metagenome TaxID=449393 RepID=A0A6J6ACB0_9ZZZZ|nr:hypothetical protein [Actinomycetota bacterium]MSX59754.1 hypothetical protein [Actinomycetota bacterium]MTB30058.1 hypothetical protein [Actinomycetota bacterium]